MICPKCKIVVYRYRIIDGQEICLLCVPSHEQRCILGVRAIYGRFGGTSAHLEDIKLRRLAEDGTTIIKHRPKTYIF